MLQSEKDAENYYRVQAKFEERQRMIDKGWGDPIQHQKLMHEKRKAKHMKNFKDFVFGGLMALFICVIIFGTNYLMHGYAI